MPRLILKECEDFMCDMKSAVKLEETRMQIQLISSYLSGLDTRT